MSRGRHARRIGLDGRVRRLRTPLILFACAFAVASSSVAFAFTTATGNGAGQAQAVKLQSPGAGTATQPGRTSLVLSWGAAANLPAKGGYLVLRSLWSGGPYARVSGGSCSQETTLMSAATSCTDTDLAPGTTYYYEVEGAYDDASTVWVSAPDAQFSGTTTEEPGASATPAPATSVAPTLIKVAPTLTSATSTTFVTNTADSFQVTATASPAAVFSDVALGGCKPSILPPGIAFSATGLLSGSPAAAAVGTYTVCINATNGVAPNAMASFTLTVVAGALAITSPAVQGAASVTPNLGPLTVRRLTPAGSPVIGSALTVTLSSSAPGVTVGSSQFATAAETNVIIPSGQSSTTFWLGSPYPGAYTVTAVAAGYTSASQAETITPAPVGLSVSLGTGSTGNPVLTCVPPAVKASCTISGVGSTGRAVFSVRFVNAGGAPVVYSATQPSTITETGMSAGTILIGANTAATSGTISAAVGTSTLTFGSDALTLTVSQ